MFRGKSIDNRSILIYRFSGHFWRSIITRKSRFKNGK
uniref:Uncharacterized protein n=1 Tax=Romanomermis culicivorax TaxID=13658 RepID=A0A915J8P3_ROMCU